MLQLPPGPAQYISGRTDMPESSCQQQVCPGDWSTWWILIPSAKPREKESILFLNNWGGERLKSQGKHQDSTIFMVLLRRGRHCGGYLHILHGPWIDFVCSLILNRPFVNATTFTADLDTCSTAFSGQFQIWQLTMSITRVWQRLKLHTSWKLQAVVNLR